MPTAPRDVTVERLAPVLADADALDVLLLGVGDTIAAVDPAVRQALRASGIGLEVTATGSAVRTYNILFGEKRAVATALIAVTHLR